MVQNSLSLQIVIYERSQEVNKLSKGIEKIQKRDPKFQKQLLELVTQVEKQKPTLSINKGTDYQECEAFARQIFDRADQKDRDGLADMSTSQTFYASAAFMGALEYFKDQYGGQLPQDIQDKIKYAKWKATDIRTAIKQGKKPTPGGVGDRIEGQEAANLESELGLRDPSGMPPPMGSDQGFSSQPSGYSQPQPYPSNSQPQYQSQGSFQGYPQQQNYQQQSFQQQQPPNMGGANEDDLDDFPDVPSIPNTAPSYNQKKDAFHTQKDLNSSFPQAPSQLPSLATNNNQGDLDLDFPSPPKRLSKLNSKRWGRIYPGMRVLYQEQMSKQPIKGVVVDCEDAFENQEEGKQALFKVQLDYGKNPVVALEDELAPDLSKGANVMWTQNGISHMGQIQDIYLNKWPPQYTLRLHNGLTQKVSSTEVMIPDQNEGPNILKPVNQFQSNPGNNMQSYQSPYGSANNQTPPPPPPPQQYEQFQPPQNSQSGGQQRNLNAGYSQNPSYSAYPQPGQQQSNQFQGAPSYPNLQSQGPPPGNPQSYPNLQMQSTPNYPTQSQSSNLYPQSQSQDQINSLPQQGSLDDDVPEGRNPTKVSVQSIDKAQKFARYAVSSLNFNDVESAITNLEEALKLLK